MFLSYESIFGEVFYEYLASFKKITKLKTVFIVVITNIKSEIFVKQEISCFKAIRCEYDGPGGNLTHL